MSRLVRLALAMSASVIFVVPASAQQPELPRPSPGAKVTQRVGLTDITIEYSSPAVKGRVIWGGLVPYEKMWRLGANAATKLTLSRDARIGGKAVAAGSYAIFAVPGKEAWTFIVSRKVDQAGDGREYRQADDVARFEIKPAAIAPRERLAFIFADMTDDAAKLELEWEKLRLSIPISVDTEAQARANIKAAVDNAWRPHANAARYLLEQKKDLETALAYADKSVSMHEDWYNVWIKAQILKALGRGKDALGLAQRAWELGSKAPFFFYKDEIKKAIEAWK